jgi:hypothetical protein
MATNRFQRKTGQREYRKVFVIAMEGGKTEPQYFNMLNSRTAVVHIKLLKSSASAPAAVLKTIRGHIKDEGLKPSDEAWLVMDKDQWPDAELDLLVRWADEDTKYGLAVSNPKFEYWLLLHFEEGHGVVSSVECSKRLKRHLPNYNKGINQAKFPDAAVRQAVKRAKQRDNPMCPGWPSRPGQTTVYRLVERILNA